MRLNQELVLAKQRDDRALGEALANGQPEPEPEADAIEARSPGTRNARVR